MLLVGKKVKQCFFFCFSFLSETIVEYDIKVGRCSQPNDFNFKSNLRNGYTVFGTPRPIP